MLPYEFAVDCNTKALNNAPQPPPTTYILPVLLTSRSTQTPSHVTPKVHNSLLTETTKLFHNHRQERATHHINQRAPRPPKSKIHTTTNKTSTYIFMNPRQPNENRPTLLKAQLAINQLKLDLSFIPIKVTINPR